MFFFQQRQEKQNCIFLAHQVIPLNFLGWKIKDPIIDTIINKLVQLVQ
jgi:hypothetical protein